MGHKGGGTSKGKRGGASGGAVRSGPTAAAKPKGASPAPGWHTPVRYATVTLLCIIAAALVTPFDLLLPQLTVPVLLGLMAALWARKPIAAGVIAAVSTLAGCTVLLSVYRAESFIAWIQTRMPAYAVQDTTRDVFDFILSIAGSHPVMQAAQAGQGIAVVALVMALTAGVAVAVALWVAGPAAAWRLPGPAVQVRVAWACWAAVVLLGASFAYTAWTGTVTFRQGISTEPADLSYSYDPVFNLKTYYMMRRGVGFYDAYVYSTIKDARKQNDPNIQDGKFVVGSPMLMRPPAAFYLWRVVGARGSDGIVMLSVLACVAILIGAHPALRSALSSRAIFVSAMLYPGLMLHTVWYNIFFPDWWAALALLGSVLLLAGRRYWEAGALAFLAVVFREVAGFWMLVIVLAAVVSWRRVGREWLARAAAYAAGLLAAAGLFAWHYRNGLPYFTSQPGRPVGLLGMFTNNMSKGIDWKLMSATSYLMLPYGMYAVPTLVMLPAGAAGFWFALPKRSAERVALTVYPLFMLAYYLTIGATSSYWGQLVMPTAVVGTAVLLARADLTIAEIVGRKPRPASDLD